MPPSTKKTLTEVRALIEKKEYDCAIKLSESVLSKNASNYHAHVYIGVAAVGQQNFQLALDSYQAAIKLRPDLPLAYKGVIQTLSKPDSPQDPLLLARCQFGLGSRSNDHAEEALPKAADAFLSLALDDPSIRDEAVSVLQSIRSKDVFSPPSLLCDVLTYRICKLLSLELHQSVKHKVDVESDVDEEAIYYEELTTSPLSEAVNDLTHVLCRNNNLTFYDGPAQLVIRKLCGHCLRNKDFVENLSILRRLRAYEELLYVAETDHAPPHISKDERIQFAFRSKHLHPFRKGKTRTSCLLATINLDATGDYDEAIRSVSGEKRPGPVIPVAGVRTPSLPSYRSCTHALVAAFVYITREEYKSAMEACKAGRKISAKSEYMKRMYLLFSLLLATSLRGDRKYKDAAREFETVLLNAKKLEDPWMIHAANRGLIINAITGFGRQSRAAAIALEEATSYVDSSNDYAIIESVWSDALSGDVDVVRMQELVSRAIDRVNVSVLNGNDTSCWEYDLLGPYLIVSPNQLASIVSTRLGQMRLGAEGYTEEALKMAQKDQMAAAGFVKGVAEPFAQLGFVMERLGAFRDREKMRLRASRCYERALRADPTNAVASRQLVRILSERGMHFEAFEIARNVSDRNPKARWALNVVGWWRLSQARYSEAAVPFHTALRGRPKRTMQEEDSLFGTDVGSNASDNDLLVDIDSWRGLSVAYRMQGKPGAAFGCLDDALSLLEKPPSQYTANAKYDIAKLVSMCRAKIEDERDILTVLSRRSAQAGSLARSMLAKTTEPSNGDAMHFATGYYAAEALMLSAAEEWVTGAYRRATEMREQASTLFHDWIIEHIRRQPTLKCAALFKRLGDMWSEAAGGECPRDLACLVTHEFATGCLDKAAMAYSKAAHLAPWENSMRVQDVAGVLQRQALLNSDETSALIALNLLLANMTGDSDDLWSSHDGNGDIEESDYVCLAAVVLLTLAWLSNNESLKAGARGVANRARQQARHNVQKLLLDASVASSIDEVASKNNRTVNNIDTVFTTERQRCEKNRGKDDDNDGAESGTGRDSAQAHGVSSVTDISECAEAAIRATRVDPTDWRGFLAVAKVREADVRMHIGDFERLQSCEQAYAEADRLGAGPVAVNGRLRCMTRMLKQLNERCDRGDSSMLAASKEKLFQEACYISAVAKRVASDVPPVCASIMKTYIVKQQERVEERCNHLVAHVDQIYGNRCLETNGEDELQQLQQHVNDVWKHVHLYPFVPAARDLLSSCPPAPAGLCEA